MKTKKITKNIIYSISAQLLSLVTSFVLSFVVPKFIDVYQYSYWQMYVLYVGYVGILHFGLLDGIVLRYSQYDYDQIDKARMRSQFQFLLASTGIISVLAIIIASLITNGVPLYIAALVSVGIIAKNIFTYTSYSFQITNRISKYALITILHRALYAVIVVLLLVFKVNNFIWYCLADLFGDAVGIVIGSLFNKGMYFGKSLPIKDTFKETWMNVSSGIFLMVSNFSSMLLIGSAKMLVQWRWDELIFGKVSFAFSASNLFLTFVTAISVVLFPSLKRMKEEELPDLYVNIRNIISPLLTVALIGYFPLCAILRIWLPKYTESLAYLGILLPIVIFSSKVSLLTNNYLKAYRKEKTMLVINMACVVAGFAMAVISAYLLNDLTVLLFSVVVIVLLRSVISEIVVMKIINRKRYFDFFVEFVMTLIFMVSVKFLDFTIGLIFYAVALVIYLFIYRKTLVKIFKSIYKK